MFIRTLIKSIGVGCLLAAPINAQFGIPQKKKGGTFEEMNQMAKDQMAGLDSANLMDELANMDPDEMMKMIQESMNDPATMQYLEQFGAGMGDVMEKIAKMNPEEMKKQIQDNLSQMSSPDILNSVLENSDEVLESLLQQGLITEEQATEYKENPAAFQEQMSSAFDEMNKILQDPAALDAALEMMSGMADILGDPSAALKSIGEAFTSQLGSDDKIEEARLQLLADPSAAGNPALASLFENKDMIDILQDPVKFREQVKKGQEMISGLGGADESAKYGEL
mmetsp:Transcript_6354/g.7865  ORF Transcript_6354/g.7865 Transcript_6354/m.7865 type:complete len:281 (-) Transcript_6354:88-930(-)|eukprot:CAMPEP_0203639068 /NCGR_PEP_ID=MMETSP0088-20131115/4914_1 /ASSEMBLY_ACC=CAM_ASM_001087 /TAXON_ID=426623 /ORGANISM="Chaetoceros affinis, Strain CCMP159" /LENGTH=280 /DNA_ID=CAMNT_0050493859 /DNA_START=20 /DNA_END=862 /DNA_ORIENTATION=-